MSEWVYLAVESEGPSLSFSVLELSLETELIPPVDTWDFREYQTRMHAKQDLSQR